MTDPWSDTDIHWEGDSWNDTGTNLYGCLKQLNLLKRRNRNLKVLLSIGGWSYKENFKVPAASFEGRDRFAKSAVGLLKDLGLDGLDVDWEYPQNEQEASDFVSLLKTVRQELDTYARSLPEKHHFELTIACPAGPQHYTKLRIKEMDSLLDFWNLMAYDYAGSWDRVAGHQANVFPCSSSPACTPFSTSSAVEYYATQGVPRHKIVLGMPIYGRAFENTDGPGLPFSGIGEGSWEQGVYDFKSLPLAGAEEREDPEAVASYSYDRNRRMMISYDTVPMARKKADFIAKQKLGGAMWWETSADKQGNESLIFNVVDALGGSKSLLCQQNCLSYPHSKYDNLRNGFPTA